MIKFISNIHEQLIELQKQKKQLSLSEITRQSIEFIAAHLTIGMSDFQAQHPNIDAQGVKQIGNIVEEIRDSHSQIINILEVVHECAVVAEEDIPDKANKLLQMFGKRISYHLLKSSTLAKQCLPKPKDENTSDQLALIEEISQFDTTPTFFRFCDELTSIKQCKPQEMSAQLDITINKSLENLFISLERQLATFEDKYWYEAENSTKEVVQILQSECRKAKHKIQEVNPTIYEIENIKQLQSMIKGFLQLRIGEIVGKQQKIYRKYS